MISQSASEISTTPPRFTVVLPVYNREVSLLRAVESVRQQTFTDWELLVVDDGSEPAVTSLPVDPRIRQLRQEPNQGVSAARNRGVLNARGDYIAFLDSDDEFLPAKLQVVDDFLSTQSYPSDLCVTSRAFALKKDADSGPVVPTKLLAPNEGIAHYLFTEGGFLLTCCLVMSRDAALKHPFDPSLSRHEDYDFMLRLEVDSVRFVALPETLVIWHFGGEQNHLSMQTGFDESLSWFKNIEQSLSSPDRAAFILRVLAPAAAKQSKPAGLRHFFQAWSSATGMTIRSKMICLLKVMLPNGYRWLINFYLFLTNLASRR